MKVLVVDDSSTDLDIHKRNLLTAGHGVDTADCYACAVTLLDVSLGAGPYGAVLCDGNFPREHRGPVERREGLRFHEYVAGKSPGTAFFLLTGEKDMVVEARARSIQAFEKFEFDYSLVR